MMRKREKETRYSEGVESSRDKGEQEKEDATLSHHLKRIIRQILLKTGSIVIEWNYRITIRYCFPCISISFTRGRNASPMDHNCHIVRIQQSCLMQSHRVFGYTRMILCVFSYGSGIWNKYRVIEME